LNECKRPRVSCHAGRNRFVETESITHHEESPAPEQLSSREDASLRTTRSFSRPNLSNLAGIRAEEKAAQVANLGGFRHFWLENSKEIVIMLQHKIGLGRLA
jgi:hypothetical protein